jgi:hypothetical protein
MHTLLSMQVVRQRIEKLEKLQESCDVLQTEFDQKMEVSRPIACVDMHMHVRVAWEEVER